MEFQVNVLPWVKSSLQDQVVMNIADGSATGGVTITGSIETNFPWLARISTTRVATDATINNWFWYECYIGGTKMFGGNPGAGATYNRKAGLNDVSITFSARPYKDNAWYALQAGEYKTSLTITVEAQN